MKAHWQSEKERSSASGAQGVSSKDLRTQAEPRGRPREAAEIRYGQIPELEKVEEAASAARGAPGRAR